MEIELRTAKKEDAEEWDRLVEESPHGTIFHTWKWLKTVEKHTSSRLYPIIGSKGDNPVGVFPVFYQKKGPVKAVFSPPPKVSVLYLGPAMTGFDKLKQNKKEANLMELQKSVDDFIKKELSPGYIYMTTPPGLVDSRPFIWSGYQVEPRYNYLTDISGGADQVWRQFKKNLRQDIERAKRRGVTVEEGSRKEVRKIHELLVERYKEQGKTAGESREYMLDLYNAMKKNMRVLVAKYEDEIVTGLIDVFYRDKVTGWVGNFKTGLENISPNDALNWESTKWACDNGFKYYETMGAANVERLYKYYSKWSTGLLVWFTARKYPSKSSRLLEKGYVKLMKPARSRLKLAARKR